MCIYAHTAWLSCCYLHACNLHRDPMRMQIRTQRDGLDSKYKRSISRSISRDWILIYVCARACVRVKNSISNTWDYHNASRFDESIRIVNFTLYAN